MAEPIRRTRLPLGLRLLNFGQRKLGTYSAPALSNAVQRTEAPRRNRGLAWQSSDNFENPTLPQEPTPSENLPPTASTSDDEAYFESPEIQGLSRLMRKRQEDSAAQAQRQRDNQAAHPELIKRPPSNRGIRRRMSVDYVETSALSKDVTPDISRTSDDTDESSHDDTDYSSHDSAQDTSSPSDTLVTPPTPAPTKPAVQRSQRTPTETPFDNPVSDDADQLDVARPNPTVTRQPSKQPVQRSQRTPTETPFDNPVSDDADELDVARPNPTVTHQPSKQPVQRSQRTPTETPFDNPVSDDADQLDVARPNPAVTRQPPRETKVQRQPSSNITVPTDTEVSTISTDVPTVPPARRSQPTIQRQIEPENTDSSVANPISIPQEPVVKGSRIQRQTYDLPPEELVFDTDDREIDLNPANTSSISLQRDVQPQSESYVDDTRYEEPTAPHVTLPSQPSSPVQRKPTKPLSVSDSDNDSAPKSVAPTRRSETVQRQIPPNQPNQEPRDDSSQERPVARTASPNQPQKPPIQRQSLDNPSRETTVKPNQQPTSPPQESTRPVVQRQMIAPRSSLPPTSNANINPSDFDLVSALAESQNVNDVEVPSTSVQDARRTIEPNEPTVGQSSLPSQTTPQTQRTVAAEPPQSTTQTPLPTVQRQSTPIDRAEPDTHPESPTPASPRSGPTPAVQRQASMNPPETSSHVGESPIDLLSALSDMGIASNTPQSLPPRQKPYLPTRVQRQTNVDGDASVGSGDDLSREEFPSTAPTQTPKPVQRQASTPRTPDLPMSPDTTSQQPISRSMPPPVQRARRGDASEWVDSNDNDMDLLSALSDIGISTPTQPAKTVRRKPYLPDSVQRQIDQERASDPNTISRRSPSVQRQPIEDFYEESTQIDPFEAPEEPRTTTNRPQQATRPNLQRVPEPLFEETYFDEDDLTTPDDPQTPSLPTGQSSTAPLPRQETQRSTPVQRQTRQNRVDRSVESSEPMRQQEQPRMPAELDSPTRTPSQRVQRQVRSIPQNDAPVEGDANLDLYDTLADSDYIVPSVTPSQSVQRQSYNPSVGQDDTYVESESDNSQTSRLENVPSASTQGVQRRVQDTNTPANIHYGKRDSDPDGTSLAEQSRTPSSPHIQRRPSSNPNASANDHLQENEIDIYSALADMGGEAFSAPPTQQARSSDISQETSSTSEGLPVRRVKKDSAEASLLKALDMPITTPIVGNWNDEPDAPGYSSPMPVQRMFNEQSVQRAMQDPPANASPEEIGQSTADQDISDDEVENIARKVFRVIRDRLRQERERRNS